MSSGLAPSKTTCYVSNLPFSLTNNDLHKIFEKYGKVVKVTIVKDKDRRTSKGVAFILFLQRESCYKAIKGLNGRELFGRKWKVSIATDNGRAAEFIRKKHYPDKTRCYECGEFGHLSYSCPKNSLGDREPPKKKEKKKRKHTEEATEEYRDSEDEESEGEDPALESLGAAIDFQRAKEEEEQYREIVARGAYSEVSPSSSSKPPLKKPKVKQSAYFSDEEEIDGD
ncbi:zinc finger CCHC-type and RNA-binding motif-containing protein 1-like [Acanthaster planci]|uniref:Zinc finger CCHC-type and RNA-binding motif-containing protein 1 n=1 Tax=Acanthaster planci TaxID=133434 RepID=A0A8B7Z2K6_ACAPL|nr:zinc finger CCHC-type and RNA-binding motif-containing protein 1-like [Acanthaster planci]